MPTVEGLDIVPRIALGVTGGIAAYKSIEILRGLQRRGCDVRVAMTRHACEFVQPLTFRALSGSYVLVDDYAADNPDPIAHITFSQTIDLLVIAPATANTLAKLANGIADDFISSTYLASTAPVLVAPAMNTLMWEHPATQRNIDRLKAAGVSIVAPDAGEMACGTVGPGRLSEPERIVTRAIEILRSTKKFDFGGTAHSSDLENETVVVTAGATREAIDPVRFISNRSSGRMGFAIAEAARRRGAQVNVIAGVTSAPLPDAVSITRVTSAEQMRAATMSAVSDASIFIAAAAVSDYKVGEIAQSKIKKNDSTELSLTLIRTPDILADVAQHKAPGQIIVGFAAETNDVIANAQSKLVDKNVDLIVANDVSRKESGFETDMNAVTILLRGETKPIDLPLMPKSAVAHRILDEIIKLRRQRSHS